MANNQKKRCNPFFLLLMISALPLIMSWFLYYFHDHFQLQTVNYGVLINPPINIQNLLIGSSNEKKWRIIYMPVQCCDQQCEKMMYTLHQVQKALGKDRDRLNLLLATNQSCSLNPVYNFEKLALNHQQISLMQTSLAKGKNFTLVDKIYLLDPLGNLFMYYPVATNPMNILKDLHRVLEVSQIG